MKSFAVVVELGHVTKVLVDSKERKASEWAVTSTMNGLAITVVLKEETRG